jgi:hypothetical protein
MSCRLLGRYVVVLKKYSSALQIFTPILHRLEKERIPPIIYKVQQ